MSILKTCVFLAACLLTGGVYAQEEGSADLFTDAYTDRFQELFFEALKQKGIENYDRAEALLLDAKKLDPLSPVLDHELARVLLSARAYARAERYALDALKAEPAEYWYLQTFMEILQRQGKSGAAYWDGLPADLPEFRMNLARWYLQEGQAEKAAAQLQGLPESAEAFFLQSKIDRIRAREMQAEVTATGNTPPEAKEGSVAYYRAQLQELLDKSQWNSLHSLSAEALELYPLQPYFYYTLGTALFREGKPAEALGILQEGEGMLLGDSENARNIYQALSEVHSSLGNTQKASYYQNKLKDGS